MSVSPLVVTMNQPKSIPNNDMARHSDGFWEIGEAAEYLKCSVRSVRRMVNHQGLPHVRIAGRLLFRKTELDGWVDAQKPTDGEAA